MKLPAGAPLRVLLTFGPDRVVPVGRLALDRGRAVLEYDAAFAASGLTVNPRFPPPGAGLVWAQEPALFEGLHGAFADSLPDAWGREMVRRRAIANGLDPSSLTVLDRLAIVGHRGAGALTYEPAVPIDEVGRIDLDALSREALDVLAGRDGGGDVLSVLERLGESSGGARPKILVAIDREGALRAGAGEIPDGCKAWIVKFRAPADLSDAGPLEAAYADMARAAGLDVAPTRLLPSPAGGPGYFATQRFDRAPGGRRLHLLSVAGLLDARWDAPSIDYHGLMGAVRYVTRTQPAVAEMFRRAAFNVAAHNRDDHIKQHAFLMDADGTWRLAPAYDLNFAAGPGGEHYLAIGGRGDGIGRDDLLAAAARQAIDRPAAEEIIERVRGAVSEFPTFASAYGVSGSSLAEIQRVLERHVGELGPARSALANSSTRRPSVPE